MFQNFPNFQIFQISKIFNFKTSKSILKSAVLPASLMHLFQQYADPTDEPNSQVYDQTFEDYELSIQDWKGDINH